MPVSLRPDIQKLVEEKVKAGLFPSAEVLVNSEVARPGRRRNCTSMNCGVSATAGLRAPMRSAWPPKRISTSGWWKS